MSLITTALTLTAAIVVAFAPTQTKATPIQSLQLGTAMSAAAVNSPCNGENDEIRPDPLCQHLKSEYNIDLAALGPSDFPLVSYNGKRLDEYALTFCGIPNRFGCKEDTALCFIDYQHYGVPRNLMTWDFDSRLDNLKISQFKNGDVRLQLKSGDYQRIGDDTMKVPTTIITFSCTEDESPEWTVDTIDPVLHIVDVPHKSFCKKQ